MPEIKDVTSPAQADVERWTQETLDPVLKKRSERASKFQSVSLDEVNRLYTPTDISDINFEHDVAFPG